MQSAVATPRDRGYRMPAEFAPHARTWMMWPCRAEVWPDLEATRRAYAAVAHAIREFEPLSMAVRPQDRAGAEALLGRDIDLIDIPFDDSWARDAGPNFVVDAKGNKAAALFRFNAWGGKYHPFDQDAAFGARVAELCGARAFASGLIAEGGGVSVDGDGTILTTETCFPNANRNPGWSRDAITEELKAMLGGDKVIWLPGNADETETDGHVDGIAVFVAPGVVLIEGADDPNDPWRAIKQANIDALAGQTDAKGRPIRMVMIPEAEESCTIGDRFCRSYVNSYVCNGGVVMPRYGTASDGWVREIFEDLFPDRRISLIDIADIAVGGGGVHCITQQEPA
ncbi:agmatine deiminase family protein [Ruegeria aquimaris]|uniref:Agmatine deiminase family protein n=1 Tax=Ruegeria aquimaris TaxID=2984333 RepID=A0ABT3ALY3_9RHOB|nr:agmatine deiminase family protein [Ruegeria sp. XHP0148]MCV2889695.1 agmatine deiminase family protein [Ruegeria sp. XHP0148]